MGVRGSFTEISPEIFEQLVRGEEPQIPEGRWHSVDKAWYAFYRGFHQKGPPLSLAMTGDCLHPLSPQTLDDFCKGGHEWYFGLVSPKLVREVAEALTALSTAELQKSCDECGCGAYACDSYFFTELKSAYASAAERGNALMIMIA
jgi:hypothetical protein